MTFFNTPLQIAIAGCFLLLANGSFHPNVAAAETPNVVIIFIDDMGWGDVGFNGATGPQTPNLDQMAADGMRMNDFYVGCPVCKRIARDAADGDTLGATGNQSRSISR